METLLLKSDKFVSFYTLLEGAFWDVKDNSVIAAFDGQLDGLKNLANRLLTYPSDIPALQGATDKNQHIQNLFGKLKNMSSEVFEGNISDIDGLKNYFSLHFGFKSDELESSYQSYSSFFEKNNKCIHENVEAMRYIYNDRPIQMPNLPTDGNMPQTTGAFLQSMRNFFDLPEDKKTTVYLHPFPDDPHLSGWSTSEGTHQTFCTKRLEDDANYITGTTMLSRRIGTPIHETGHWMFANSPMMDEFRKTKEEQTPAVRRFLSVLDGYFKENPETEYHKPSALRALDEALASSAGVVVRSEDMKDDFNYKTDVLYHGFKAGNDLARIIYPIFHEYISSGKKMSDGFIERVVADKEFQKCFCMQKQKSSLRDTLNSLSNTQTHTTLNSVALRNNKNNLNR